MQKEAVKGKTGIGIVLGDGGYAPKRVVVKSHGRVELPETELLRLVSESPLAGLWQDEVVFPMGLR